MKITHKINEIRDIINNFRQNDKNNYQDKIALIPTMGALHNGHLSLIKTAKQNAKYVIATIFINPLQFNNQQDFIKYPKNISQDLSLLAQEEVDAVFIPDIQEIYPDYINNNIATDFTINIIRLGDVLCGKFRPNHFNGMAMIILKLFNIIKPDIAIFGEKDFQQAVIIKKIISNFNFDIDIVIARTIRQNNGLALSSRNLRLNSQQIITASNIFANLQKIRLFFITEINRINNINQSTKPDQNQLMNFYNKINNYIIETNKDLIEKGFDKVEYLEIYNQDLFSLIDVLNKDPMSIINYKQTTQQEFRIFIAAELANVRLIDNLVI